VIESIINAHQWSTRGVECLSHSYSSLSAAGSQEDGGDKTSPLLRPLIDSYA